MGPLIGSILTSSKFVLQSRNSFYPRYFHQNRSNKGDFTNQLFLKKTSIPSKLTIRKHEHFYLEPLHADNNSRSEGEDNRGLDAVLKFYTAIRKRNIHKLSDTIANECRYICSIFSYFQSLLGKKQVVDFFRHLMESLGHHVELIVHPTLHDGLNVGIHWKLEWSKTHMPLGKGFSFYISQIYQGKVLIRNVEMFIEPLLHIEPIRLEILSYVMNLMNKIQPRGRRNKASHMVLPFFFTAILAFFIMLWVY